MKNNNKNLPFDKVSKKSVVNGASSAELTDLKKQLFVTDVKGQINIGYLGTLGTVTGLDNSNWFYVKFKVGAVKTFIVNHKAISPFFARMTFLDSNGVVISRDIVQSGEITVPNNCVEFGINFPTPNSTPALPSGATLFPSKQDLIDNITVVEKGAGTLDTLKKQVMEIPVLDRYNETLLASTYGVGYYHSGTGAYNLGTNWFSTKVDVTGMPSITMKHAETTTCRMVFMNKDVFMSAILASTNTTITLPYGCTEVRANFPLANSTPDVPEITDYASKTRIEEIKFYGQAPVYRNETLSQRLTALSSGNANGKVLRILSIGNSFSQDADEMLYDIAKSAGVELIIGNMYMGGQTLQGHMQQVTGNLSAYTYQKRSSAGRKDTANVSLETGIKDEPWDIITFQQGSPISGQYATFQPYLNDLITYVKGKVTNPSVKYALHMTWAYSSDSTQSGFDNYGNNQMTMYNAITDAYLKAMQEVNFSILIPSGTAVQNARTNPYLKAVGRELTRDGYHMDLGIGRFIAGLTFFATLVEAVYDKDIFAEVTYNPSNDGATPFLAFLAKIAVRNAINNPFKVTNI